MLSLRLPLKAALMVEVDSFSLGILNPAFTKWAVNLSPTDFTSDPWWPISSYMTWPTWLSEGS